MQRAREKINFELLLDSIAEPLVLLGVGGNEVKNGGPEIVWMNSAAGSLHILNSRGGNGEQKKEVLSSYIGAIPGWEAVVSGVISGKERIRKNIYIKSLDASCVFIFSPCDSDFVILTVSEHSSSRGRAVSSVEKEDNRECRVEISRVFSPDDDLVY